MTSDPNETLQKLREAYSRLENTRGNAIGPFADAASDLRDAAVALDEWLSGGGLLPDDWHNDRNVATA